MSGGFGVDSFDSKLPVIRAKGGWLGSQNSKLSVLFVVIDGNNKQYTRSAVGCLAADQRELRLHSMDVRLTDARTYG